MITNPPPNDSAPTLNATQATPPARRPRGLDRQRAAAPGGSRAPAGPAGLGRAVSSSSIRPQPSRTSDQERADQRRRHAARQQVAGPPDPAPGGPGPARQAGRDQPDGGGRAPPPGTAAPGAGRGAPDPQRRAGGQEQRRQGQDDDQAGHDEAGPADQRAGRAAQPPGAEDGQLGRGRAGQQVGGRDAVLELGRGQPAPAGPRTGARSRAMCAGGPPNPMHPIRPHSRAIVSSETCGTEVSDKEDSGKLASVQSAISAGNSVCPRRRSRSASRRALARRSGLSRMACSREPSAPPGWLAWAWAQARL